MADIELVVKIPEEIWEIVKDGYVPLGISKYLKNGTPLPKGHGRLIDADKLESHTTGTSNYNEFSFVYTNHIKHADTIIEADDVEE